ncbi:MAG: acyl carrier protein [Lachnospiraceae bacterium]|nr:acyl carrier protein [Lachnospiraceae bacterium]
MSMERVKEIIVDTLNLEAEKLTPDADLIKDLDVDSIDVVELVMALEEEYDIEIPDEDVENLTTLGKISAYIDQKAA